MLTMKNTKQELFDAYSEALKKVEEVKKMKETPADVAENKRKVAVEENAAQAVESNIFSDEITRQYEDLMETIENKQKELQELYDIEVEASSLAAIINAAKEKDYQLEEEFKAKREKLMAEHKELIKVYEAELDDLISQKDSVREEVRAARAEEIAKVKQERQREEEEYGYNLTRQRKIENDKWEDEKAEREKILNAKEEAADNMFVEAESKLDELEELREKVAEIPVLIANAEKEAKEAGQKEAAKEYGYKKTMYEKEKEYEIAKLEDKVSMLEEKLEQEESKTTTLQSKLDDAYTKMNTLASETVKANGAVRIVSSGTTPASK